MVEKIRTFKDLRVWQGAYQLALAVYQSTRLFPKEELYGIVSQMRRACISIVSNISEGYGRKGRMEYTQFLSISYASLAELETQCLLSRDLKYLSIAEYKKLEEQMYSVGALLYVLIGKLKQKPYPIPHTLNPKTEVL